MIIKTVLPVGLALCAQYNIGTVDCTPDRFEQLLLDNPVTSCIANNDENSPASRCRISMKCDVQPVVLWQEEDGTKWTEYVCWSKPIS